MAASWMKRAVDAITCRRIGSGSGRCSASQVMKESLRDKDSLPKLRLIEDLLAEAADAHERSSLRDCLQKQLSQTANWKVALNLLFLIHVLLRAGDEAFTAEVLAEDLTLPYTVHACGHRVQFEGAKSRSRRAWECCRWTAKYAAYIAARLHLLRIRIAGFDTVRLSQLPSVSPQTPSSSPKKAQAVLQQLQNVVLECSHGLTRMSRCSLIFGAPLQLLMQDKQQLHLTMPLLLLQQRSSSAPAPGVHRFVRTAAMVPKPVDWTTDPAAAEEEETQTAAECQVLGQKPVDWTTDPFCSAAALGEPDTHPEGCQVLAFTPAHDHC